MKTENGRAGGKIFYGWWVVLAAWVGLNMAAYTVIAFSFGVFFGPLSREFDWSRSEVSFAFSLFLLAGAFAMPLVGRTVDRFGARKVVLPSAVIYGLLMASLYFLNGSLWHFYAVFLTIGVLSGGTATVPYFSVITRWFNRRRGLAMGLAMSGTGFNALIIPFLTQTLIERVGWRGAFVILGLLAIAVTVPVVGLLLKEEPKGMGLLPDGDDADAAPADGGGREQGVSAREALRTSTFWFMAIAMGLVAGVVLGCLAHLAPLLTDRGMSAQTAALATSALGGATLFGRVGAGYLLDRFFAPYVAVGLFAGAAVGLLLLWLGANGVVAFGAAILLGLAFGGEGDILAYLVSRYFGLRAFGEVYSYAYAILILGGMAGPVPMGYAYDKSGAYDPSLLLFLIVALVAAGLMALLGPYRRAEAAGPQQVVTPTASSMNSR